MIKDEIIIDKKTSDEIIFIEPFLGLPFASNEKDVYAAILELNAFFFEKGLVSLHKFYELLGLPDISITWNFGWSDFLADELGYDWVDISLERRHKRKYLLNYRTEPLMGFAK
jgi:hypothetical protein